MSIIEHNLQELVDIRLLEEILTNFASAVGISCIAVDSKGTPVTKEIAFTDFCMEIVRQSPEGLKRCYSCDAEGGRISARTGKEAIYSCHAGLVDFAVPIIIEGKQIGSILGGQILVEPVDPGHCRRTAENLNLNPDEFLFEINKVPLLSREKINNAARCMFLIANTLSDLGYQRKIALGNAKALSGSSSERITSTSFQAEEINLKVSELSEAIEQQQKVINESTDAVNKMLLSIQSVNELSASGGELAGELIKKTFIGRESITKTNAAILRMIKNSGKITESVKIIDDISGLTNVLAMNASIQAAHAGESGKGFAVVAREIRKLSVRSAESTRVINGLLYLNKGLIKTVEESAEESENSFSRVESGVNATADSLSEILFCNQGVTEAGFRISGEISNLRTVSERVVTVSSMIKTKTEEILDNMRAIEEYFKKFK